LRLFTTHYPFTPFTLWSLADALDRLYDGNHEEQALPEALGILIKALDVLDDDDPDYDNILTMLHRLHRNHMRIQESRDSI
jgi:uncharacterized protein YqcC (DUF446 family)